MAGEYFKTLIFTDEFFDTFGGFKNSERRQFRKALRLLDEHERHPSLRVHELKGALAGVWSASASEALRMTFTRLPDGKKVMLTCSHHYDR
jgi:mRNA-degrading endonuclease YafQ of YafQ-DinJ toxin-antitoxin module